MKFTLGWLREHLATDASLDAIVEALVAGIARVARIFG